MTTVDGTDYDSAVSTNTSDRVRVLARDEKTGEIGFETVLAQYTYPYRETVYIRIADLETGAEQTLVSNRIHPIYVANQVPELKLAAAGVGALAFGTNDTGRWVKAHDLIAGDRLLTADESWAEVVGVDIERKPLVPFNLTVADFHTFFVKAPGANDNNAVWVHNICDAEGTYAALRKQKLKDAHHVIQNVAVRDLPGYSRSNAPAVQLMGPSTLRGSPHHVATQIQRQAGGGTYAAERRIGYRALRRAGYSRDAARSEIQRADEYFSSIGVTPSTPTRIPGDRRR